MTGPAPEPARRPVELGLNLPYVEGSMDGRTPRWSDILAMAQTAESIGFDGLWISDHVGFGDPDGEWQGAWESWTLLSALGALPTGTDPAATSRAWYDELRFAPVVATGLRERGLDEAEAWSVADLVRVLLDLPRPGTLRGTAKTLDARLLQAWLARDDLRAAIGVNTWEGTDWLDRDRFAAMLTWSDESKNVAGSVGVRQ